MQVYRDGRLDTGDSELDLHKPPVYTPRMADGKHPNIIVILADDLGFSDLGCYGGEVRTPHLDDLATHGVRFTDFYCTPRCCPSRASLLTGLTPHKAGMGWMTFDWKSTCDPEADGYVGTLNDRCITLAEALHPAGYRTYMSGKWHVTAQATDRSTWPVGRGFDRSFAVIPAGTSYFHPTNLVLDDKFYRAPNETYVTDLIGKYASRFVREHLNGSTDDNQVPAATRNSNPSEVNNDEMPFLLYLAFTAPHFPLQAPEDVIAPYRELYARGWDELRSQRYERMKQMGIIAGDWTLPPRPSNVPAWTALPAYQRERSAEQMATYAAMIEIMDNNIGRLVETLKRNHALDDTVIMFLSDNGACAEGPVLGGGTMRGYGESWAHLSNTPLQLYKMSTKQGGVQTPFVLHWPAGIGPIAVRNGSAEANLAGRLTDWTGSLYDIMPTCLELADVNYPVTRNGNNLHPLDGESMVPALAGPSRRAVSISELRTDEHEARKNDICMEHEGNQMLRSGRHKVVRQHSESRWQLFDMERDRTEMSDLSGVLPARLAELAHRYHTWENDALVIPWALGEHFMDLHGFSTPRASLRHALDEAIAETAPEEIVDGETLGD